VDPRLSGRENSAFWDAVDRLVERAPRQSDLYNHRLELFEARRLRKIGLTVPPELAVRERRSAATVLTVPVLLDRVRAATDVPLLLFKGPEVAARYPDPALRVFRDVDLIAANPGEAQRALLAAGFQEVGDPELYRDIHHLRPLRWPGLPLVVELHSRPKWIEPLAPPSSTSLFADARPDSGGSGLLAPSPAQHAVLLAVHSWAHEPLRILRDLVDVGALWGETGDGEVDEVAREWGVERLWSTTAAACECVFSGGRRPGALRVWAQNLERVRERTVLEEHVQRWVSDFSALPPRLALGRMRRTLVRELAPDRGEGWRRKLSRSGLAFRNADRRRSDHEREAGGG
jgi:Uncharacterised nucleotidyltransferase